MRMKCDMMGIKCLIQCPVPGHDLTPNGKSIWRALDLWWSRNQGHVNNCHALYILSPPPSLPYSSEQKLTAVPAVSDSEREIAQVAPLLPAALCLGDKDGDQDCPQCDPDLLSQEGPENSQYLILVALQAGRSTGLQTSHKQMSVPRLPSPASIPGASQTLLASSDFVWLCLLWSATWQGTKQQEPDSRPPFCSLRFEVTPWTGAPGAKFWASQNH